MRRYKITLAIVCSLFWATSCQWNNENKEKTETPAVETKSPSEKQPVKQPENLTFSKYNYFKKSYIDDNTKLPGCTIDIHISYRSRQTGLLAIALFRFSSLRHYMTSWSYRVPRR